MGMCVTTTGKFVKMLFFLKIEPLFGELFRDRVCVCVSWGGGGQNLVVGINGKGGRG